MANPWTNFSILPTDRTTSVTLGDMSGDHIGGIYKLIDDVLFVTVDFNFYL